MTITCFVLIFAQLCTILWYNTIVLIFVTNKLMFVSNKNELFPT